jgi:hypothetical protein
VDEKGWDGDGRNPFLDSLISKKRGRVYTFHFTDEILPKLHYQRKNGVLQFFVGATATLSPFEKGNSDVLPLWKRGIKGDLGLCFTNLP